MPVFLKKEAVRLFEASVEFMNLALVGLGLPSRIELREKSARYAPHIGLIGAAAELAMSACMVQAFGQKILLLDSGKFKSGRTILDEFRRMLNNPVPRTLFITKGVMDEALHRHKLIQLTNKFGALITARAGGFHAGRGLTRDVCIAMARDVIDFLNLLAKSSRIRAYLTNIPEPPDIVIDRQIILEDLVRRLHNTDDLTEKAGLVSAIYLVLPEIPDNEPTWLSVFDKVTIAPREQDLSYLLDVLERSNIASLFRVAREEAGETIPVVVRPNDDLAIPIEPQYLRRAFTSTPDQFYADVANANGRLESGIFDVPPYEFVLELFVFGLEETGIIQSGETLPAQRIWPFVLSSMNVQGSTGPYWFLLRSIPVEKEIGICKKRVPPVNMRGVG